MKILYANPAHAIHPWLRNYADVERLASSSWLNENDKSSSTVNIVEQKDGFYVEVTAPGFTKENFMVDVEHNIVLITASIEHIKYLSTSNTLHPSHEYYYYMFKTSFRLPNNVIQEKIRYDYVDNVLKLVFPKKAERRKKQMKIH